MRISDWSSDVCSSDLEVVQTDATDADTLATAFSAAKRIAKIPVLARNCDGFIGNRMVAKRSAQAERLLQEGALPQDVDEAIRAFGFPMGPLQTNEIGRASCRERVCQYV